MLSAQAEKYETPSRITLYNRAQFFPLTTPFIDSSYCQENCPNSEFFFPGHFVLSLTKALATELIIKYQLLGTFFHLQMVKPQSFMW